jgi:hypothetical protein
MNSHDIERFGHNIGIKFKIKTEGSDHAWASSIMLNLYREKLQ